MSSNNLANFLFGNVDDEGNLESEDLDDDLKQTLQGADMDFLNKAISGSLGGLLNESKEDEEIPSSPIKDDIYRVKPRENAIDFSNLNELADDNEVDGEVDFFSIITGVKSLIPSPEEETHMASGKDPVPITSETTTTAEALEGDITHILFPGQEDTKMMSIEPLDEAQIKENNDNALKLLKQVFPSFEKGKLLQFTELFTPKIKTVKRPVRVVKSVAIKDKGYDVAEDDRDRFYTPSNFVEIPDYLYERKRQETKKIREEIQKEQAKKAAAEELLESSKSRSSIGKRAQHTTLTSRTKLSSSSPEVMGLKKLHTESADLLEFDEEIPANLPESLDPIVIDTWEDKIIWEEDEVSDHQQENMQIDKENEEQEKVAEAEEKNQEALLPQNTFIPNIMMRNQDLDDVDWTLAVVWDDEAGIEVPSMTVVDPTILPLEQELFKSEEKKNQQQAGVLVNNEKIHILDMFNISDDQYYEVFKNKSGRMRQTHGPIRLQHSIPAIKLMYPYFKYQMTIQELRSFHRPPLRFFDKEEIKFSRVKNSKIKKKDVREKELTELMRAPKDLSLRDTAKYVFFEYSEEHPPIMMNTGMASLIYNYYRKVDDKDTYLPQVHHGSPYILEQVDASPFSGFGDVGKGQTISCLYNNIFRAPIFKHEVNSNDFLVIRYRSDAKSSPKYYIREIPYIFCVGQTFPAMEVPRPQSRRITAAMKARLQVSAFRLMRQDPLRRLRLEKLCRLFPEFSEGQIRQKVKEFCVFQRRGLTGGFWKLKPGLSLPSEEELRKLLGPENACLYESMLVGEQWLKDAGYATNLDYNSDDEDEDGLDIEVQLAPWTITRNFLQAAQGKCMLKLHGPGDPTGIGEGFSFIKTSMKEMFMRAGEHNDERYPPPVIDTRRQYHRYNIAEQQQAYKDEINRIWNDQVKSLSATQEPVWEEEGAGAAHDENNQEDLNFLSRRDDDLMGRRRTESNCLFNLFSDNDMEDAVSVAGSITSHGVQSRGKVLVINRLVRNDQGTMVWKPEAVTDQRVMTAYLKQRALIDKEMSKQAQEEKISGATKDGDERVRKQRSTQEHLKKYLKQSGKVIDEEVFRPTKQQQQTKGKDITSSTPTGSATIVISNTKASTTTTSSTTTKTTAAAITTVATTATTTSATMSTTKSITLTLKIPMQAGKAVEIAKEQTKKKREYLLSDTKSRNSKRKKKFDPLQELNKIFGKVIDHLIAKPEAFAFCKPVNAAIVKDYYDVITRPRTLEQIRDDVRSHKYFSSEQFFDDLQLVADNCYKYNGSGHPLSGIITRLIEEAQELVEITEDEIEKLEEEISEIHKPKIENKKISKNEDTITIPLSSVPVEDYEENIVIDEETVGEDEERVLRKQQQQQLILLNQKSHQNGKDKVVEDEEMDLIDDI